MSYRRLKVYKFHTRIPKTAGKIKYCQACFAKLVLGQSQKRIDALHARIGCVARWVRRVACRHTENKQNHAHPYGL